MKSFFLKVGVSCLLIALFHEASYAASSHSKPDKKPIARSVYYQTPGGYVQVGNTNIYCSQRANSVDVIGKFGDQYYSSTYSDQGYKLAMKVGKGEACQIDCQTGTTVSGINCRVSLVPQGELARVVYTVTNTTDTDTTVSLGTHADVMIGGNDRAPISRRIDTIGKTYGLTMKDGNGAQLCVLFGAGLVGVNSVSDFWFGYFGANTSPEAMVGNYTSGDNYMLENGSYDSGMGWCWKDRPIPAKSSVEFSYLIGVGEVNLEPNSSFEVTPEDPEGWNDLSRPHLLTLDGEYESPAGQRGKIQYAVEDALDWLDLTEELESGSTFTASLVAMFDAGRETHTIRFRTIDAVGNTSLLTPIVYKDVSFHALNDVEDKVYNFGDSLYQTNLTCDLPTGQYLIGNYKNNINAGVASFDIEGVFPYTIGKRTYSYVIKPLPLESQIILEQDRFVYSGNPCCPLWDFSEGRFLTLEENKDYSVIWSNNILPGNAELRIVGKGNFSSELVADFLIDKAQLNEDLYAITLPNEDITFDGMSHGASISVSEGVGTPTLYYTPSGVEMMSQIAPTSNGTYDIYMEIADGELYYGKAREKVFTYTIYEFDENDWATLQAVCQSLTARGWSTPWDLSGGISTASHLQGLTVARGNVVELDLSDADLTGFFPVEVLDFPYLRLLDLSGNGLEGPVETVVSYLEEHPRVGVCLTGINIANNSFSGNLGLMAACFPNLTSIEAFGNCLSDIYPVISEKVVSLNVYGQNIDRIIECDLSEDPVEAVAQQIPTILLYDHTTQNYCKPILFRCSTDDGFSMILSYKNGNMEISADSDQNVFRGQSGDIFNVTAINGDASVEGSTLKLKLVFENGDANFDGGVDVMDLQSVILFAFDDYNQYPFNYTAADIYCDGIINVQDVICMANILLNTSISEVRAKRLHGASYAAGSSEACVYIENDELYLYSERPVAAIDIAVEGEVRWDLGKYGFKEASTGSHLIGYSLSGITLPTGKVRLGKVSNIRRIAKCILSDSRALPIVVSTDNVESGIEGMDAESDEDGQVYDVSGIKLPATCDGVNIVIGNNGVRKVMKR